MRNWFNKITKIKPQTRNEIGKITPVKKAFCPICMTMLVPLTEVACGLDTSSTLYCTKCKTAY